MALIDVDITVDLTLIQRSLQHMARFKPGPVLRQLRKPTMDDQREHRNQQRGPQGPWAPLAPSTKEKYARMGLRRNRKILARLPLARRTKIYADRLVQRSPVKWSLAHMEGAIVGRGSHLPQRQYWWISPKLVREVRRQFERALAEHWAGRSYP